MTANPTKFTFDLDLGRPRERNTVVTESTMKTLLAEARAAGFAEGVIEGENGVRAQTERQLAAAAGSLADRVATMAASIDDTHKAMLTDAVAIADTIARKLAGALLAREPASEIEALIADCLGSLDGVPHLVIRCHSELADVVREATTSRMAASGFAGRLVVMGDPEQALGDCRIEWADGGLVRDHAATGAEIDKRVAAFLAAHGSKRGASGAMESER